MLLDATPKPKDWTETFKGALIDSCGVVLFTAMFLVHAPWWVVLGWTICSITLTIAMAVAHKRNQPNDYATVCRLDTIVFIVMWFVFLVNLV